MAPELVVVHRKDGLGARLKAILHGINIGQKLELPVLIIWPITERYPSPPFEKIFDGRYYNYINITRDIDYGSVPEKLQNMYQEWGSGFVQAECENVTKKLDGKVLNRVLTKPELKYIEFKTNKQPLRWRRADLVWINKVFIKLILPVGQITCPPGVIRFHPKFVNNVKKFLTEKNIKNYIAVHVRRGDLTENIDISKTIETKDMENVVLNEKWAGRVVSLEKFCQVLTEIDQTEDSEVLNSAELSGTALNTLKPIVICSDNPVVIEYFKDKYGERVYNYPITEYNDHHTDAIDGAIYDLLLLAQAQTLVCDAFSNFSHFAKHLGQIENVYPLVRNEKKEPE